VITVALDAGHGQDSSKDDVLDPGAVAGNRQEHSLAWKLVESGIYVAREYFAGRIAIALTRDSLTESAPLGSRTAEAASEGADYLISIHLNSASAEATGTETLYRDGDAGDIALAKVVQTAALNAFGLRDRGLKPASSTRHKRLAILEGATRSKPGALLEVCFLSNPSDVAAVFADSAREARIEFWRSVFSALAATTSGRTEL
jgi:N-acetylmuramoyl-L-alanine amidase